MKSEHAANEALAQAAHLPRVGSNWRQPAPARQCVARQHHTPSAERGEKRSSSALYMAAVALVMWFAVLPGVVALMGR